MENSSPSLPGNVLKTPEGLIEEWRDITGYAGLYQVSNFGNVRSYDRIVRNRYSIRTIRGRVLRPSIGNSGYYFVNLSDANHKHCCKDIHRLEALEFFGFEFSHLTVNHKDGNKLNNFIVNLEMITQKQNNDHKYNVLGKTFVSDKRGCKNPMFGKNHSSETKLKISIKRKLFYEKQRN